MKIETTKAESSTWRWRCVITLGAEWNHLRMPVKGQGAEGAWVDGFGMSPEDALDAAYKELGRAVVNTSRVVVQSE